MGSSLIRFTVYGEAVPWKRPRFNGKTKAVFEKSEVKDFKKRVIEAYNKSGGRFFPKDVPLRVTVYVFMGVPASASEKKQRDLIRNHRPTKRPDNDNLYKGITDALNKVAYYDDSQIVDTHIYKFWSGCPRAEVEIEETE